MRGEGREEREGGKREGGGGGGESEKAHSVYFSGMRAYL